MIDFSKYEKVSEFTFEHGCVFYKAYYTCPVIFMMKIGEELYVNATMIPHETINDHEQLLWSGKHYNKKMVEAFKKEKTVETYILEQIDAFDILQRRLDFYLNEFQPSFNVDECKTLIRPEEWKGSQGGAIYNIAFDQKTVSNLKTIEEQQNIPIDKLVLAATRKLINDYHNIDTPKLSDFGLQAVQSYLMDL